MAYPFDLGAEGGLAFGLQPVLSRLLDVQIRALDVDDAAVVVAQRGEHGRTMGLSLLAPCARLDPHRPVKFGKERRVEAAREEIGLRSLRLNRNRIGEGGRGQDCHGLISGRKAGQSALRVKAATMSR